MKIKLSKTEIKDRQTTPKTYQCIHCDQTIHATHPQLPKCRCGRKDYHDQKEFNERENALKKIAEYAQIKYTNENRNHIFTLFFKLKNQTLLQQTKELSKKIRCLGD